MKYYTYGWELKQRGWFNIDPFHYSEKQKEMASFISELSNVINHAQCGWAGLQYKVMQNGDSREEYMRLYVEGEEDLDSGRWIPITANSKACNISVLAEHLFS